MLHQLKMCTRFESHGQSNNHTFLIPNHESYDVARHCLVCGSELVTYVRQEQENKATQVSEEHRAHSQEQTVQGSQDVQNRGGHAAETFILDVPSPAPSFNGIRSRRRAARVRRLQESSVAFVSFGYGRSTRERYSIGNAWCEQQLIKYGVGAHQDWRGHWLVENENIDGRPKCVWCRSSLCGKQEYCIRR